MQVFLTGIKAMKEKFELQKNINIWRFIVRD